MKTSGLIRICSIIATTQKDSPYHDCKNKKVIGKFKDEAVGVPVVEFVGLRSKMYSYVKDNGKNEKTAKGVKNM